MGRTNINNSVVTNLGDLVFSGLGSIFKDLHYYPVVQFRKTLDLRVGMTLQ